MTKAKSIEERPIIIVNTNKTTWGIEKRADTGEMITVNPGILSQNRQITEYKIVKVKAETATSGRFRVWANSSSYHNYYNKILTLSGTIKAAWECEKNNINQYYNSLSEALAAIKKVWPQLSGVLVERIAETYFNTETKEITASKEVALNWFKDRDPLFISSGDYQRIGIWLNPGTNFVEVNYYYNDHITRKDHRKWTKAKIAGFRLYNDGTISHFYKNKYYLKERPFVEKRVKYRSLDVRFIEQQCLSTPALDLRSKELIGSNYKNRELCSDSLNILKQAGFPQEFWCWGENKRPFQNTYDLVNFAVQTQKNDRTEIAEAIEKFLVDKPFGPEYENVFKFKNGILIRVPEYKETRKNTRGEETEFTPYGWVERDGELVKAEIYEKYRIWIDNKCKNRSCQKTVHDNQDWVSIRWDSIIWPTLNHIAFNAGMSNIPEKEAETLRAIQKQYCAMLKHTYNQFYNMIPVLTRFKSFVDQHQDLAQDAGVCNFIQAIRQAPKLTETLIKLGHGEWFYRKNYQNKMTFHLSNVLNKFGVDTFEYTEFPNKNMYQNLGISKEQFAWLSELKQAEYFMNTFKKAPFIIPNTQNQRYDSFATVPVKYLKCVVNSLNKTSPRGEEIGEEWEYYATRNIRNLFDYDYSPVDIEKAVNKKLDLQMLVDYLRMRSQCDGLERFNIRDWDKIPSDQTDLRFCHNRICEFYNLMLAERESCWRRQEEERMIERQKMYDVRYKKLKAFTYKEEDNSRIIVVPEKLIELVVEGQVLHHCVGSFATSVAEGKDTIVFLRDKDAPTISYATISLLKVGDVWKIDQAHTAYNGPITPDDVEFLKRWAKKNNVDISTVRTNYGAHCHH